MYKQAALHNQRPRYLLEPELGVHCLTLFSMYSTMLAGEWQQAVQRTAVTGGQVTLLRMASWNKQQASLRLHVHLPPPHPHTPKLTHASSLAALIVLPSSLAQPPYNMSEALIGGERTAAVAAPPQPRCLLCMHALLWHDQSLHPSCAAWQWVASWLHPSRAA